MQTCSCESHKVFYIFSSVYILHRSYLFITPRLHESVPAFRVEETLRRDKLGWVRHSLHRAIHGSPRRKPRRVQIEQRDDSLRVDEGTADDRSRHERRKRALSAQCEVTGVAARSGERMRGGLFVFALSRRATLPSQSGEPLALAAIYLRFLPGVTGSIDLLLLLLLLRCRRRLIFCHGEINNNRCIHIFKTKTAQLM